ncbi:hypothetical protein PoB_006161800 [Plakobranchus ocellatus]|uniref:Uncharacterized protein n=1 Tax=Plakobranchus ocellatus TaxID=259542 RepID=A0AAV4CT46_9GAST|nr:hypothetical protein PoB_006161800 [Plakobranchus ocellatus]
MLSDAHTSGFRFAATGRAETQRQADGGSHWCIMTPGTQTVHGKRSSFLYSEFEPINGAFLKEDQTAHCREVDEPNIKIVQQQWPQPGQQKVRPARPL